MNHQRVFQLPDDWEEEEEKERRKEDHSWKILVLVLIFALFFLEGLWAWQGIYLRKSFFRQEEQLFVVKEGQGLFDIASALEEEGLIKDKYLFTLYVLWNGHQDKLQAGSYYLSSFLNVPQITWRIVRGDVAEEKITIVEGWNLNDIGKYFEEKGFICQDKFFLIVGFPGNPEHGPAFDFSSEYDFLKEKPQKLSLEGFLFPDTYYTKKPAGELGPEEDTQEDIMEVIREMLDTFRQKLTQALRAEIENQGKSIFEIVTMASLLEKEVRTTEDKKIVAGILWKRMENDIPLQVDATITYLTGKKSTKVSIEETKIDSPYNTYKHKGLPVGPICNPGLESIEAAVYPKESEYWFYLSTPEGKTIFSETLEEHNIAKQKYLKNN
ncbi:MAG: endolytic transglycosylase MltG [Candidatus Nealsonbacteria bacterium]|nr:endolytic transglycosylase MltG [Candidatus Nealsonbacteria bacterium]